MIIDPKAYALALRDTVEGADLYNEMHPADVAGVLARAILNPPVAKTTVGPARAHYLVRMLMTKSQWFEVAPLPEGMTEISVKIENAGLLEEPYDD